MSDETIPQMRERIEELTKELSKKDGEIEKLGGELRVRDAREAFRLAGYNPKHGDLFARENPEGDIDAEAVAQFADTWDLAPADTSNPEGGEEESADDVDDGSGALADMNRSGSRSGAGGGGSSEQKTYTRSEWLELNQTDPAAAAAALNQGRVETSGNPNVRTGEGNVRPGDNPYATQYAQEA